MIVKNSVLGEFNRHGGLYTSQEYQATCLKTTAKKYPACYDPGRKRKC